MRDDIIYSNQWCKIVLRGTIYVLISLHGKYNDQYFNSAEGAFRAIGLDMYSKKKG